MTILDGGMLMPRLLLPLFLTILIIFAITVTDTNRAMATQQAATRMHSYLQRVGWIGLGAMGAPMGGHVQRSVLSEKQVKLKVWNRDHDKAVNHATAYGTCAARSLLELSSCSTVFVSLPTTKDVESILLGGQLQLNPGSLVIDTTSGDPAQTRALGESLIQRGICYVDCPVSGGPAGAKSGSLTTMIGSSDKELIYDVVMPLVTQSFSKKAVYCGGIGSGMAVKSINNILNTAHLLIAAEGLLALQAFGVNPEVALEVINASSGRSLATQERIPTEVVSGRFGYGFKLGLMAKDCTIASSLVKEFFPKATLLPEVARLTKHAEDVSSTSWGSNRTVDYTEVVRLLEDSAGIELRSARSNRVD